MPRRGDTVIGFCSVVVSLCGPVLVSRGRFPFGHRQEHGLWPQPKQEVPESRTSGSSAHSQKFETIMVVNGYNIIPFPRLCVFLTLAGVCFLVADRKKSRLWGREWCDPHHLGDIQTKRTLSSRTSLFDSFSRNMNSKLTLTIICTSHTQTFVPGPHRHREPHGERPSNNW